MAAPTIERLKQRYEQLSRQDDVGFVRGLSTYLATLDDERRVRRILARLRREADDAAARFNKTERELVADAVRIRGALAGVAPEIDDSGRPPPAQTSPEYGFWKVDSLVSFDRTAPDEQEIGYAPLPYYGSGYRGRVERLIQILRGRLYAAEYGVQAGRGQTPQSKLRDDLASYAVDIDNLHERYNAANRQFSHEETTLAGLADERLRLFVASLSPEPFLRDANEDEDVYLERTFKRVLENLGARGLLRRVVAGERLTTGEQDVFTRLVTFLRAEVERLHEEIIDQLQRGDRSLSRRIANTLGLGSRKVVAAYVAALLGLAATASVSYVKDWWGLGEDDKHSAELPPISTQVATVIRRAARRDFDVEYHRVIDLRGTGLPVQTRLFVFRHPPRFDTEPPRSDELHIYETRGGRLHRAREFRPLPTKRQPSFPSGNPIRIEVVRKTDLGRNGSVEVLALLQEVTAGAVVGHPVLIRWDPAQDRYDVLPLLKPRRVEVGGRSGPQGEAVPIYEDVVKPHLASRPRPMSAYERHARRLNMEAATIVDGATGSFFATYGVDAFVVREFVDLMVLTGGYVLRSGPSYVIQVERWLLLPDPRDRTLAAKRCSSAPPLPPARAEKPHIVRLRAGQRLDNVLNRVAGSRTIEGC